MAAVALLLSVVSCTDREHGDGADGAAGSPDPVDVRVAVIRAESGRRVDEIAGTVQSEQVAVIESQVAGTVREVAVTPGQTVARGDVLIRLDAPEIEARRDQALAQFERAREEFEKFQRLFEGEAVSRLDYDRVKREFERARAALDEAETLLGYTTIRASFDGLVTRRMVDPGNQAIPGRGLLVIEDPARFEFAAQIPEGLITSIRHGETLAVSIDALDATLDGVVSEIAPSADPSSRTFLVKLTLPPADGLRGGLFGRALVPVEGEDMLAVPDSALVRRGQLEMLFIVQDDRARMRLVRSGRRWDGRIEIVSGLEPGERVVVGGAASLRDGQPVTILP